MNLEGLAPFGLNPLKSLDAPTNETLLKQPVDSLAVVSQTEEENVEAGSSDFDPPFNAALEEVATTVEENLLQYMEEPKTLESLIQENHQLKQMCQTLQEEIEHLQACLASPLPSTKHIKEQGPKWAVPIQWRTTKNKKLYELLHPKQSKSWFQSLFKWIKRAEMYTPPQW